ncbi:MAG: hypothetical protein Q9227_007127 [Pyrenula ochraceoflavens]
MPVNIHGKKIELLDGGLGTCLEDLCSINFSESTPLWSSDLVIRDPKTLEDLQQSFSRAGADILLTATYQASFQGFAKTSRSDETAGISREEAAAYMRSAVSIAQRAHEKNGKKEGRIALSLGAYGATMLPSTEYSGEYDPEHLSRHRLLQFHLERLRVFTENRETWENIDYVAFETLPRSDEIYAVREAMQAVYQVDTYHQYLSHKPFWISCVYPQDDQHLPDGSSIEQVAKAMFESYQAQWFGRRLPLTRVAEICPNLSLLASTAQSFLYFATLPQSFNLQFAASVMKRLLLSFTRTARRTSFTTLRPKIGSLEKAIGTILKCPGTKNWQPLYKIWLQQRMVFGKALL